MPFWRTACAYLEQVGENYNRPIRTKNDREMKIENVIVKLSILCIVVIVHIPAYAQTIDVRWNSINIYEYGMPITSCECNFENLLYNWDIWIANNEETKLLSYEFVEQLEDTARIAYYANLMYSWNSTGFIKKGRSGEYGGVLTSQKRYREFYLFPTTFVENYDGALQSRDSIDRKEVEKEIEKEIEMVRKSLTEKIQIGDKVFLLKFQTKVKTYDYYVICDSKYNKIVFDTNLQGIAVQWFELKEWLKDKE